MYQHNTRLWLLVLAGAYPGAAQNPYTVIPKNYRLEFENESVRVSRAMFFPGDKLPVHDHPGNPTVFVYLTDGGPIRFIHVEPQFTVERPAVKEGGIRFHSGATETHIVEYMGDLASEYLRIELKTERPEKNKQHIRIAPDDPEPFENSQLRISRTQCAARQPCAESVYPAVIVRLNDRALSWYEAGSMVRNERDDAARQIRVELKTRPLAANR